MLTRKNRLVVCPSLNKQLPVSTIETSSHHNKVLHKINQFAGLFANTGAAFYIFFLLFFFTSAGSVAQTCDLQMNYTTQESACKATGIITINVTNGSGNYNYTVLGVSDTIVTSSNNIEGLKPGTYLLKVKDLFSGCILEKDSVVVTGSYQDPRFGLTGTYVTCINGMDGTITVDNIQFGRPPFTYSIVVPSASGVGTTNTTGFFNNLSPGDYSIQLTDSCGGRQTRIITIDNYNWQVDSISVNKIGCDSAYVTFYLKDDKGHTSIAGYSFPGFTFGVSTIPGDTTWSDTLSFHFYKGKARNAVFVAKDKCGNTSIIPWTDPNPPTVDNTIDISNTSCNSFTATVTGWENLASPQFCLYNGSHVLQSCNNTGIFNNLSYGAYCIDIIDKCYDTTITRCFMATQPIPDPLLSITTTSLSCKTFRATAVLIPGEQNFVNPQFCLFDNNNNQVACNTTGIFDNLGFGSYCIRAQNDPACYDTSIRRCFEVTQPLVTVDPEVLISNRSCDGYTAAITGQVNIVNGQYCLYDTSGHQLICNTTGVFNNVPYGTFCIRIQNDPACYDTVIQRCFTAGADKPFYDTSKISYTFRCGVFNVDFANLQNFVKANYCLYDASNNLVRCDSSGRFDDVPYGSYCVLVKNNPACYDTSFRYCFTQPPRRPSLDDFVTLSNKTCSTFSVRITGERYFSNIQICLYDQNDHQLLCTYSNQIDSLPYGSYCLKMTSGCYDTTIVRCFTAAPDPLQFDIAAVPSCTIGNTDINIQLHNGNAPYTVNIYGPANELFRTVNSSSQFISITGLPPLDNNQQYRIMAADACGATGNKVVLPKTSWVQKNYNVVSKCPSGAWQNGSGDLNVEVWYSEGGATPVIIRKNDLPVTINYNSQHGRTSIFSDLEPAVYVVEYSLAGCSTLLYDTIRVKAYSYPNLNKSAVYQCNANNFSVSAAIAGGFAPFSYEIIGSNPSTPSINQGPQGSPTFYINNGTSYSMVRLRVVDMCGNAAINDAGILPLANIIVTASSDCFYNDISLTVDSIPGAVYTWYKKTSPVDSVLIDSNQTHIIPYLLPPDTGMYVCVVSVNNGCLTKITSFNITGACGKVTLANEKLTLTGKLERDDVQLQWTTGKDFDAIQFAVERSHDGIHYSEIGRVNISPGNRDRESMYLFSDVNVPEGNNYYRIRIIRLGVYTDYSKIVLINKKQDWSILITPNPVRDAFTIRFNKVKSGRYNLRLIGADGRSVMNNVDTVQQGDSKLIGRPPGTTAGIYFLVIQSAATNDKKIIKLIFE